MQMVWILDMLSSLAEEEEMDGKIDGKNGKMGVRFFNF